MEHYDTEMAERVWQRVRGQTEPDRTQADLPAMIAGEWADAATYLHLSRHFQGRDSAALRKMFEQEQSHSACLKGIYTLLTGQRPVIPTPTPPHDPPELTLRRCYGREMQCLARYEQLSSHPEYGPVFEKMAQQEREHCRILLELLGRLKQPRSRK